MRAGRSMVRMTSKLWLPKERMLLKIAVTERETMLRGHHGARMASNHGYRRQSHKA